MSFLEAAIDVVDEPIVSRGVDDPLSVAAVDSVEPSAPISRIMRDATSYHGSDDSESDTEQELSPQMRLRSRSGQQNPFVSSRVECNQDLGEQSGPDAEGARTGEDRPMLVAPTMRTAGLEYFCPDTDCFRHSSGGEYGWKRRCGLINHLQRKHPGIAAKYHAQSLDHYMHSNNVSKAMQSAQADLSELELASTDIAHSVRNSIHNNRQASTSSKHQPLPDPGKEGPARLLESQEPSLLTIKNSGYFCPTDPSSSSANAGPPHDTSVSASLPASAPMTDALSGPSTDIDSLTNPPDSPGHPLCSDDINRRYREMLEKTKAAKVAKVCPQTPVLLLAHDDND